MSKKKSEQLGMPFGTASARLRKLILFNLLQRLGEDICFHCNNKIDKVEELSIEHKEAWLNVSPDLFWDLNNISFSHLSCNSANGKRQPKRGLVHGTRAAYNLYKCRCDICRKGNAEYCKKWRKEKNIHP